MGSELVLKDDSQLAGRSDRCSRNLNASPDAHAFKGHAVGSGHADGGTIAQPDDDSRTPCSGAR